jgi:hypothetical protein
MPKSASLSDLPPAQWLGPQSSPPDVQDVIQFLTDQGTFHLPSLPNGLFSAAAGTHPDFELTGYHNVWLRDNIHVAWSLWDRQRDPHRAVCCIQALLQFYRSQHPRLKSLIDRSADPSIVHNRPHIRFDGPRLIELAEKWPHAQNDALGYFLWLTALMLRSNALQMETADWETLTLLIHYFETIRVWEDEDSGHWEENRKVAASSIGCVCAGLQALSQLLADQPHTTTLLAATSHPVSTEQLRRLLKVCRESLQSILPWECRQTDPLKSRAHDAALLFLLYPLNQVDDAAAEEKILRDIHQHLAGHIGIRRYNGDSYWCNDYRKQFTPELRSSDFSEDIASRDRLLNPGFEAQWCLFDPILACIYGRRYQQSGRTEELEKQLTAVQRSLAQLTRPSDRFPPFRCPESWFCENGEWIPNDITPLLWTQGNLIQALDSLKESLQSRADRNA